MHQWTVVQALVCGVVLAGCGGKDSTPSGTDAAPDLGTAEVGGEVCQPNCTGKECGDDGCGGTCGECEEWQACGVSSTCKCVPACESKQCGPNGCGGTCGVCCPGVPCQDGICLCVPDCKGRECGPNGAGGYCIDGESVGSCWDPIPDNWGCPEGLLCDVGKGKCVECILSCWGKECGDDGCGGSCGSCEAPRKCSGEGSCVCEHGECGDGPIPDGTCKGPGLGMCEEWICADGCCAVGKVEPPACCLTPDDCRDCVHEETWERKFCPKEVPDGFVPDLCTIDTCMGGVCVWFSMEQEGYCSDGNSCTLDACEPATGYCLAKPECNCDWYCYGATQAEADAMCDYYGSPCMQQPHCYFNGPFVPWSEPEPPPDWSGAWGLCGCLPLNVEELCDDKNECTTDGCSHFTGCFHIPNCGIPGCCVP